MKSLFILILFFGGSFKAIEVTADSKLQDICVDCVEELMEQAWADMKKAGEASYQALGAFLTSLSVDENGTLSLSNPATLSQLKSATVDFDKAKKAFEAGQKNTRDT